MKPYDQLTRLGKIRRQRKIVEKALELYDLDVASVDFLADHTNTLFKITSAEGTKYAFRIYTDGENTLVENRAEVFWLTALDRDTDLNVPVPIANKDGEYITLINLPGVPPDQRCQLMSWIPGKALADIKDALNKENYFKYGQAQAKLHNHSESLHPLPADISPKKWDKVFYYPEEPVVYNQPEYSHLFSAEQVAILDKVIAKANKLLGDFFVDRGQPMLIHGDFHYWNLHLHKGELYLIDFEDLNFGYDTQDVAITFYYGREQENAAELRQAFKEGYSSQRPWPLESEEQLQTLITARIIMFCNFVAHGLPEEEAKKYLEGWFKNIETFAQTYC
ncbi:MAG: phosphotransferase [Chloroflexota bacterium]